MTTPNPPSGQAVPTEFARDIPAGPQHAAPHGLLGDITREVDRMGARLIDEVRALCTPARLQELATLTRELAVGTKDAGEVIAWLGAHGL